MARSFTPALAGMPRVNLMPRSEIARRERDQLTRVWVWAVAGAVVLALLIIGAAFALSWLADQRLAAEQAKTADLTAELASLSDVNAALATEAELTDFRTQAMATDIAWAPAIAKITSVLPPGSELTGYDLIVGGAPQGDDPTVEEGLAGTVFIDSPTPIDIVTIVRSLRGVDGVLFADGQSVTSSPVSEGRYAYQLNLKLDQTIYSGDFAADAKGGK